ncbi:MULTISPECIES: sulfurtransferase complex subunit TusC [Thiocapsa]|uniref:Sulfur relay protein TusC/DsrF n=2 Tax=Thiocapsa TaxID=1056 RepID=F9UDA9_9GAMM|nr:MULTISPECIES: sulfurtransferase complex subunit TusC [Thiocapsa]AHW46449.1 DsrF [Thiocapsa roseopersicina]EGV17853.1 sulfur relay protein TusC/DsrF [Thiocapsa marina 5811]UHD17725.1 sulfurtransferase complex subunit TusC [Thiocapsa bogorovii]SDW19567.1 tRNA 2-thiouridine synthesizing protein C [Thiocapsa roseopersicina]
MSEVVKKFMYLNRKAPYGTIYAWEALEVVLIGAAFDQDVSVMFLDDGVYQLTKGQDTKAIGMKNFSPTFRTLGDYEVKKIYVDRASLEARGLTQEDLVEIAWEDFETEEEIENIVEVIDSARVGELMNESDAIFSF